MNSSIKTNVLALVTSRPQVVGNDNLLVASYWIVFDKISKFHEIPNATPSESILRIYRGLVNEGTVQDPRRTKKEESRKSRTYVHELATLV